jgi:hypothetical protein
MNDAPELKRIAFRLEQHERDLSRLAEAFDRWLEFLDRRASGTETEEEQLENAIRAVIGLPPSA